MEIHARLGAAITRVYDNPEITLTLDGNEASQLRDLLDREYLTDWPSMCELRNTLASVLEGLRIAPKA